MVDFVIVGGKLKKAKARFGGESGRKYDRSFERRHLKLTARQIVEYAIDDLVLAYAATKEPIFTNPSEIERHKKFVTEHAAPAFSALCRATERVFPPRAVSHNNRKVVAYPDGMRIYSANY